MTSIFRSEPSKVVCTCSPGIAPILARIAYGDFQSPAEGARAMVRTRNTIVPGENAAAYDTAYQRYCNLNNLLLPTF